MGYVLYRRSAGYNEFAVLSEDLDQLRDDIAEDPVLAPHAGRVLRAIDRTVARCVEASEALKVALLTQERPGL